MKCDLCGQNAATVHLTEIIDDESRELHLCEACAQEKGAGAAQEFGLAGLLAGLTDFGIKPSGKRTPKPTCPECGLTYEDFRKSGRLGCGDCYTAFRPFLVPLLKHIHGSTQHVGRIPTTLSQRRKGRKPVQTPDELNQLKEQLKTAVVAEAFEEAARLRDQIRALETKPKKRTKDT